MKLIKFLMKIKNETVTVEMKNGVVAMGTIISVDNKMNIYLKQVKISQKGKSNLNLENYSVRGSMIRYVILPETIPLDTLLIDDGPKKKGNILLKSIKDNN